MIYLFHFLLVCLHFSSTILTLVTSTVDIIQIVIPHLDLHIQNHHQRFPLNRLCFIKRILPYSSIN